MRNGRTYRYPQVGIASSLWERWTLSLLKTLAGLSAARPDFALLLLVIINIAGMWYAWNQSIPFAIALENVFSEDEMAILASIIAFHFGGRAFSQK